MKNCGTRVFLVFLAVALFFAGIPVFAEYLVYKYEPRETGTKLELKITDDGHVSIRGGQIQQIVGTTFFIRLMLGKTVIIWTIKTDKNTSFIRKYGGNAQISELAIGDYIDAEGEFSVNSDSLNMTASMIKDYSLQKESGNFSGKISAVLSPSQSFFLTLSSEEVITLNLSTTTKIIKGAINYPADRIGMGDKIISASGTYNFANKSLLAKQIEIYQNTAIFQPRNFQGKIKSVSSQNLPSSIVVAIDGKDYKMNITTEAKVLNKKRELISFSRFIVGDTIRLYGAIKEDLNLDSIEKVEIVRNLDL